jgi:hypothetical protein
LDESYCLYSKFISLITINHYFFDLVTSSTSTTKCWFPTICPSTIQCATTYIYHFDKYELLYQSFLAYPYPQPPPQQQSIYPQVYANQQPSYNNTTVVVQPSPVVYGGGGGGNSGYQQSGMGTKLATAGLGFAGGTVFGGKILQDDSRENI